MFGRLVVGSVPPDHDFHDFETITTERSQSGRSVLGDDTDLVAETTGDSRTTVFDTRERARRVDPSVSTDEAAVERFLADTDFDAAFVLAVEVPVPRSYCYTVVVESVSIEDGGRATLRVAVERARPECLDAPTVLTCFVRVRRQPAPATVTLELDAPDGVP